MKRYYLDQLKNHTRMDMRTREENDSRRHIWDEQREKYGFTWSMDTAMTELLYERLLIYLEKASEVIRIRDERKQAIEEMISLLKQSLMINLKQKRKKPSRSRRGSGNYGQSITYQCGGNITLIGCTITTIRGGMS